MDGGVAEEAMEEVNKWVRGGGDLLGWGMEIGGLDGERKEGRRGCWSGGGKGRGIRGPGWGG